MLFFPEQVYMEVAEQPQARGFRFRYPSEGSSHGGLQGELSARHKKSYPAVRVSISLIVNHRYCDHYKSLKYSIPPNLQKLFRYLDMPFNISFRSEIIMDLVG